jgi:hypothetical protein
VSEVPLQVVERLQELKESHPDISYGDFYTFAG